jgi:hypothetical protein
MRRLILAACLAGLLPSLLPLSSSAQTSVGFAHPDHLQDLLAYRLPDWGYRLWDVGFALGGAGSERRLAGAMNLNNQFSTSLDTGWQWHRESETVSHDFAAYLDGGYSHSHSGSDLSETSMRRLTGQYYLSASWDQYLGASPLALRASLRDARYYAENVRDQRIGDVTTEAREYTRNSDHRYTLGAGYGRIRDVVPLLRAERLAERLVALGHERPGGSQVRQAARVLASEYGYRAVFDRHDRRFWSDVLQPLLGEEAALSPYEIMYLAEVLSERLGERRQGWQLRADFQYQDGRNVGFQNEINTRRRSVDLSAGWYHNLSLSQQIFIDGGWRYDFNDRNEEHLETGAIHAELGHLWNLADRHLLENTLTYDGDAYITEGGREKAALYELTLTTYLEDRLSLNTGGNLGYAWRRSEASGDESIFWTWNFSVGLTYHLDRVLF